MSIESWKKEFYPVEASEFYGETRTIRSVLAAVDHSIRKWEGIRPANLKKHGLEHTPYGAVIESGDRADELCTRIELCSETCSLCQMFSSWECDQRSHESSIGNTCSACPLSLVNQECCTDVDNAYDIVMFNDEGNNSVEPMIRALKKARTFVLKVDRDITKKKKAKA